ncbi:hypothetical protein [Paenibacillus silviterrae]|uniref:hypothetical protein n=1 Tax=Paenibacillus silviterrae TaxID=3242194 RepID=UPI003558AF80
MIREATANDSAVLSNFYKLLAPASKNSNVLPERIEQIKKDENDFFFSTLYKNLFNE